MGGQVIRGDEECRERRAHRAERRARCAERREARARDREALKRLPRRERLRVWWRMRPLGVTFTVYLAVYLAVATAASLGLIGCSRPGTTGTTNSR